MCRIGNINMRIHKSTCCKNAAHVLENQRSPAALRGKQCRDHHDEHEGKSHLPHYPRSSHQQNLFPHQGKNLAEKFFIDQKSSDTMPGKASTPDLNSRN